MLIPWATRAARFPFAVAEKSNRHAVTLFPFFSILPMPLGQDAEGFPVPQGVPPPPFPRPCNLLIPPLPCGR